MGVGVLRLVITRARSPISVTVVSVPPVTKFVRRNSPSVDTIAWPLVTRLYGPNSNQRLQYHKYNNVEAKLTTGSETVGLFWSLLRMFDLLIVLFLVELVYGFQLSYEYCDLGNINQLSHEDIEIDTKHGCSKYLFNSRPHLLSRLL